MNKLLILMGLSFLSACAVTLPMAKVIDTCNGQDAPYLQVSRCIQDTYSKKGNTPNASSVKAFYAELAVIDEDYKAKKITEAQAKANLYRAFNDTVEKADRANRGRVCMPINGMIFCQ
jgi:hypothetical protein